MNYGFAFVRYAAVPLELCMCVVIAGTAGGAKVIQ